MAKKVAEKEVEKIVAKVKTLKVVSVSPASKKDETVPGIRVGKKPKFGRETF